MLTENKGDRIFRWITLFSALSLLLLVGLMIFLMWLFAEPSRQKFGWGLVISRRKIGMVFQTPCVFPTMSIFQNVAVGLSLNGCRRKKRLQEAVEKALLQVGLFEEVAGQLARPAFGLSVGQVQRLCIARVLAVEPEVILLDESCSALDPISSFHIEELLLRLKQSYTLILVTHNLQQVARVSDYTVFLNQGEVIEYEATPTLFITPRDKRTENFITGRPF